MPRGKKYPQPVIKFMIKFYELPKEERTREKYRNEFEKQFGPSMGAEVYRMAVVTWEQISKVYNRYVQKKLKPKTTVETIAPARGLDIIGDGSEILVKLLNEVLVTNQILSDVLNKLDKVCVAMEEANILSKERLEVTKNAITKINVVS